VRARTLTTRRLVFLASMLFGALVLSGCGWDSILVEETPTANNELTIEMTDTAITPAHLEALKGDVTFKVTNNGTKPHNLAVTMGKDEFESAEIAPGESTTWTLHFPRTGQYALFSNLADDHEAGMETMVLIKTD